MKTYTQKIRPSRNPGFKIKGGLKRLDEYIKNNIAPVLNGDDCVDELPTPIKCGNRPKTPGARGMKRVSGSTGQLKIRREFVDERVIKLGRSGRLQDPDRTPQYFRERSADECPLWIVLNLGDTGVWLARYDRLESRLDTFYPEPRYRIIAAAIERALEGEVPIKWRGSYHKDPSPYVMTQ